MLLSDVFYDSTLLFALEAAEVFRIDCSEALFTHSLSCEVKTVQTQSANRSIYTP